ncbi:MAG: hypothetical protein ACOYM3_25445 [Terrimicrobiaceae bacterium]
MKRFLPLLLLLIFSVLAPSCASKKEPAANAFTSSTAAGPKPSFLQSCLAKIPRFFPKKQKPPSALPPQWVGVIRMVNTGENFVLVESGAIASAIPGETYLAVGKGAETASLRMTALKNPPFLIADILSGTPSAGDKIYLPKASRPSPTPSPTPKARPTPKEKKAEANQKTDPQPGTPPGASPSPDPANPEKESGH